MPRLPAWLRGKQTQRENAFARATHGDLDIVMPPPYDMPAEVRQEALDRVQHLIDQLKPEALDEGSRDVLNNLINAWADQDIARLAAERDERQAVGDILVGLARERVARLRPQYDADVTRVLHTAEALEVTFEALTGKKHSVLRLNTPRRLDDSTVGSTLGPVDLCDTVADCEGVAAHAFPPAVDDCAPDDLLADDSADGLRTRPFEPAIGHPGVDGAAAPNGHRPSD
jgi:hypothetical protein